MSHCGFYLPIQRSTPTIPCRLLPLPSEKQEGNNPFISIVNEETSVITQFLDALAKQEPDSALFYISKNYVTSFDLNELSDFFHNTSQYKCLVQASFMQPPKNCKTSSIMLQNKTTKQNNIIHVHLIKEPDRYSNWKIYGIDRE